MSADLLETKIIEIVEKLKLSKIKNIISIDNDWLVNENKIDIKSNLLTFLMERNILTDDDERELSNDGSINTIEQLLISGNEDLNDLKSIVNFLINSQNTLSPTLISLQQLFDGISKLMPEVKIEKTNNPQFDFSRYADNCLIILDKDMGEGYSDVIVDSVIQINKFGISKNDIILIYSSESISEYSTNKFKLDHLHSSRPQDKDYYDLLIYKMWAISKKGTLEELLPEIYEVLLKSMYGNALYNVIQYKISAEQRAYSDLIRIDSEDLSNTIKDSYIDGDNIILSLNRIYDSLKSKHEIEKMDDFYMKSIESLISFERENINVFANEINRYNDFRNDQAKKKIKLSTENASHHAIVDYSVNKFYSDISTGDIFKFKSCDSSDWKYGLLISQSCSCVLRIQGSDISNIQRSAQQMQLLVLNGNQIKDNYSNNELKEIRNNIWPVKIDNEQILMLVPTSQIITINDSILDLCTLNFNGQANLEFNIDEIKNYKPYHSTKYFETFKTKYFGEDFKALGELLIGKYENMLNDFFAHTREVIACTNECSYNERIGQETNNIRDDIFDKTISLKYNIDFSNNCFSLARIGRLEPKRTLILIQDYVYNLSKTGADPIPV